MASRRLHVLSLCPWVPVSASGHAGGDAVRRHLAELVRHHDVTVVAPGAADDAATAWQTIAVPYETSRSAIDRRLRYLRWLLRGLGPGPQELKALRAWLRSPFGAELIAATDLIEVHHEEMLPVLLGAWPEDQPVVVWCHDLVTAELADQRRRGPGARLRVEAAVRTPGAAAVERRGLDRAAGIVTVNPDEGADLERQHSGRVRVSRPYILEPVDDAAHRRDRDLLVVAAWGRPVNAEALRWFVDEVWPAVLRRRPTTTCRIVGSGLPVMPSPEGVELVGFADDLAEEYARARIAAVPARSGAGLKLTVAQALAFGLPVVATSSGARGYGDAVRCGVVTVTDDAVDLAGHICRLLDAPDLDEQSASARRWWQASAAERSDDTALAEWYVDLAGSRRG